MKLNDLNFGEFLRVLKPKINQQEIDATRSSIDGQPCIICGNNNPSLVGVYVPDNSQEAGAPIGKNRVLFYRICETHDESGATIDQIEAKIFSQALYN